MAEEHGERGQEPRAEEHAEGEAGAGGEVQGETETRTLPSVEFDVCRL